MMKKLIFLLFILLLSAAQAYSDQKVTSTVDDQKDITLTVYNNDTGVITETRDIKLPRGKVSVLFNDIPSSIIPESVLLSGDDEGIMSVLEQHYAYDLLSPQKLIDKYVGKKVKLVYRNPLSDKEEVIEATILSNAKGTVFKIGNEITFNHPGRIVFPDVPEDLIASPTLIWLLQNSSDEALTIQATYLARNLNWKADYMLLLDKNDVIADLHGWVTIDNRSGIAYRNADLKLVAGEIHTADQPYRFSFMKAAKTVETASQLEEKEFFEYHLYELRRKTTINNNQKKQLKFIDVSQIPVKKRFIVEGKASHYYTEYRQGKMHKQAGVYIYLSNNRQSNLGLPLPAGLIRVYKYDDTLNIQFAGEDRIDHTPEEEDVRIMVGRAFDVISERKQTDWIRIAEGVFETSLEIKLRNHKDQDIVVTVREPVPGEWRVLETSHDFRKTDANTLEFDIDIPGKNENVLKYRVRVIL